MEHVNKCECCEKLKDYTLQCKSLAEEVHLHRQTIQAAKELLFSGNVLNVKTAYEILRTGYAAVGEPLCPKCGKRKERHMSQCDDCLDKVFRGSRTS